MKSISSSNLRSGRRRACRLGICAAAWTAVAVLFAAAPASARPVPGPERVVVQVGEPEPAARTVQRGGPVSLEQAIAMAQSRYEGRVVRAETKMRGGRAEHEIRILGEGNRVRIVRIDAQSGRFM